MGSTEGRTHIASRPLSKFDFTGRTGNIYFDLDGINGRDAWYLEIIPTLADLTGHVFVPGDPQSPSGPVNGIRIRMNGNGMQIIRIFQDGTRAVPDLEVVVEDVEWSSNYNYKVHNESEGDSLLISY